jgi:hypothetical protein
MEQQPAAHVALCLLLLSAPAWSQKAFVVDAHVHMISRQLYHGGDIKQVTGRP